MRRSGKAHYVRKVSGTRVPRMFVYLDTEAHRVKVGKREVQTFRCAVAAYDSVDNSTRKPRARQWHRSTDIDELWEWITSKGASNGRTVLVAHNLAYDMRISRAFDILPGLGWKFKLGRVDNGQAWFIFRKGSRSLVCVDSLSWVSMSLAALGDLCGIPKLALPEEDDDDETWFARCTRDVEILAEVWGRLMRWVEDEDLGTWKISGAGQAWSAYRHRFMRHNLLVHECDDARAAERAAAHTGRCEAWQHGKLTAGPYAEWDFTTAYAVIGRDCDVPTQLKGELWRPTLEKVLRAARSDAVLCEVEVTTDVPTVPRRVESGISWPVGTFGATLWENEIAVALAHRAHVDVRRAWLYRRAPALRSFCQWVLDGLDGTRSAVDPVVRVALKHWSRALIGRTAAQWSTWQQWGAAPTSDVMLSDVNDVSNAERYQMMQLGTDLFRNVAPRENPDAMVGIMSWVMAESRVRLWEAMTTARLDTVCYVDTDSLIVTANGSARLARARIPGLRIKGEWRSIEVFGPRQLIPGATLRASGVPKGATRTGERTWEGEVWSGLGTSLTAGQADQVTVTARAFRLRGTDNRRHHLPHGATEPFRVDSGTAEGAQITA